MNERESFSMYSLSANLSELHYGGNSGLGVGFYVHRMFGKCLFE